MNTVTQSPHKPGPAWDNSSEAERCVNISRPLTRSLILGKEGLAMNATRKGHRKPKNPIIIPPAVAERAATRYEVDNSTGCHTSTYSTGSHGYAQIGWQTSVGRWGVTAHRAAWVYAHGQIPEAMTIDHMCKNRRCVNVEHLRLLTNYENARRTAGRDWPLGRCANGHPNSFLELFPDGRVHCGICAREIWKGAAERERKAKLPKLPKPPRTHCRNGHEKSEQNTYIRPNGRKECSLCKQAHARKWQGYSTDNPVAR